MAPARSTSDQSALVDALVQASFVTTAALTRIAAGHDLSLTQLRVLGILRDRRIKMSELAAHLGLDRSTVSGLVDRAQARGLVARTPSRHDRRGIDVELTRAGATLAARGAEEVARALAPMSDALNRPEARRLTELLEKMTAAHHGGGLSS